VVVADAAVEQVAERPFVEVCDLRGGAACLLSVQMVQGLTDGVLPLIMLRCYSYF
jgi:hypothetical protein